MSGAVAGIGREQRRGDWLPYVAGGATIAVLACFLIYPMGVTLLASFVSRGQPITPDNLTLSNFETLLRSPLFRGAVVNSAFIGIASATVATLLALPAAYALARVRMPLRNLILALSVIPLMAPPFIGAYSWIILLGRRGIITHFVSEWLGLTMPSIYGPTGIVIALALSQFPYVLLFVYGALSAADPAIEESAEVMGASRWRILRTITFPLILPTILAGALIVMVRSLGNFGVPAILGGEYYVLPTLIYYQLRGFFDINAAAAIALANVLLPLVAIVLLAWVNRRGRFVTVTSTSRRARRHDGIGARIGANLYVWAVMILGLLPQIVVVTTSFAEHWGNTLLPTVFGLANYRVVQANLAGPILNSLLLAGAATLLCVVFGTLTAYVAARKRFVGKWALDTSLMLPIILPGIVTGVAFVTAFNSGWLVLTGTATILILAYFVRRIGYIFRSVSAAIGGVDPKIEEASVACGATWGQTLRRITVPLVTPGILAGATLVFSTLITEMSVTIILYSARWKTISIAIFEQLLDDEFLKASAIGTVATAVTVLLVFAASRLVGRSMAEVYR